MTGVVSNQASTSHMSAATPSEISYGVDWSDRARPTSHCWFPLADMNTLTAQTCIYPNCSNDNSKHPLTLLQCGSCDLTIHAHHLNDSKTIEDNFLPQCRPSFTDDTKAGSTLSESENSSSVYDQHFWLNLPTLQTSCGYCQQASRTKTIFTIGSTQLSTITSEDIVQQVKSVINAVSGNSSSTISQYSQGVVCLWCSQSYHESCWLQIATENSSNTCDYGMFRNIIVRPQWLTRFNGSRTGFQARLPSNTIEDKPGSNSFPYTPVIMFINQRSGGQVGDKIYRELIRKLNPRQVFLLENNDTITRALEIYSSLPNVRICVFGGDGTVGWVLGRLAEIYPSGNNPPVGICPLGTGNDLSRVLAWGEQYDPKFLFQTLISIPQAQVLPLDRWGVQLEQLDGTTLSVSVQQCQSTSAQIKSTLELLFKHPKFVHESNRTYYENYQKLPNTRFINYMSFGLDAAIALDFHDDRTRDPSKFSSPLKNKLMYLNESCKYLNDFARANMWNLASYIRLLCDDHDFTDAIRDCHTLVILNIPGYASGTNPWGQSSSTSLFEQNTNQPSTYEITTGFADEKSTNSIGTWDPSVCTISSNEFHEQDFGDRKIEVLGLNTAHMAAIHIGFRGKRIAQCKQLRVELNSPMTAQMDGEPFYLPASVAINITNADQVLILQNQK